MSIETPEIIVSQNSEDSQRAFGHERNVADNEKSTARRRRLVA